LKAFQSTLSRQWAHLHAFGIEVSNLAAARAHQVVVLAFVRLDPEGAVVHAHFAQHSAREEGTFLYTVASEMDGIFLRTAS
jgi:hypothetical protein